MTAQHNTHRQMGRPSSHISKCDRPAATSANVTDQQPHLQMTGPNLCANGGRNCAKLRTWCDVKPWWYLFPIYVVNSVIPVENCTVYSTCTRYNREIRVILKTICNSITIRFSNKFHGFVYLFIDHTCSAEVIANTHHFLKGQCPEIFYPYFFVKTTSWATHEQPNMVPQTVHKDTTRPIRIFSPL